MQGLEGLQQALKAERAAVPCRRFLKRVGNEVVKNTKPKVPVNFGFLKGSITQVVIERTPVPTLVRIGSNEKYAPFVEFGRPPGKQPPYDAIDLWYRRKNQIGPDDDVTDAVNNIRRAIGKRGTAAQPYLAPGFKASVPMIQRFVFTLGEELEKAFADGSR
jgi:hypothetical protein